ncbi:LysR family transcriptional regulator substrate-binding protein [Edaphobacter bradus]|uniref:LysR family transcriptional regulator substrate-binding protein n=1 Tax=Edaphobacter bradus TaxID=2259016 RepID=UPI0021E09859|nr:LysR family transcriptional regulator substrate-binding protein [Edaphobacter bradus]
MFPKSRLRLASGKRVQLLERLAQYSLDCALLPMPIGEEPFHVQQISQSPLVICMRADDPLSFASCLDLEEIASRLTIFRDPELQPAAHRRLEEMFNELGVPINLTCSASTPADLQWMVKSGYGLALIDQTTSLEAGLITKPIAGVNWTADTAFVIHNRADHIALPFLERSLAKQWTDPKRKRRSISVQPEQLKLLA